MSVDGYLRYLTIGSSTYEVLPPVASSNSLGGVKVGSGLSITNDGTLSTTGGGTVTSIGLTNGTNGGLSISGSPITSSGSITVGHSNVLSSAQTTSAVYPIKIDKNGHISEYGSAVSIPTKVSDLTNDSGFITGYTETDPIFGASAAAGITSSNISSWNGKQDALVSGTNIKTINNTSLLGSGNIDIQGDDGYSPNASVSKSGSVATITITDKNGTTSASVSDGSGVPSGGTSGQVLTKHSATDYDVSWEDASGGAYIVTFTYDDQNETWSCDKTAQEIYEAYESGMTVIGVIPQHSEGTDDDISWENDYSSVFHLINVGKYVEEGVYYYTVGFALDQISTSSPYVYSAYIDVEDTNCYYGEGSFSLVSTNRKINNKPLSSDITLTASDVGAQPTLVSGTNIKTINNTSLLGSGNIDIQSGSSTFVAEYGVTTYADVSNAYNHGATLLCERYIDGVTYLLPLYGRYEEGYSFYFGSGDTNGFISASVSRTLGWQGSTVSFPSKTSDLTNDSGFITGMEILSYGNSTWQNFIDAYNANKVVYCRASSNSNPASGSQTRLAFMAYVNNGSTPTEVEFQYYRSVSSHSASQQGDQVYVYKLNKTNGWSVTTREAYTKIAVSTGLTSSYSNGVLTASLANTYGDTKNPYGTKTANYVLAGPTGGNAAVPSFRALVAADIPDLSSTYAVSAQGIPSGGTSGQVLAKNSNTNYDAGWITLPDNGAFYVTFTYDDVNDSWSCDKTVQQIYEAYIAHKTILAKENVRNSLYYLDFIDYDEQYVTFTSIHFINQWYGCEVHKDLFEIENDVVSYEYFSDAFVPYTRKVNNKALSADVTLTASDVGAQEALVSGTNIKTVNNTSLLGSGNITINASGTSTPTASTIAEFDSSAKMNSTNMTSSEVTDFVESLDISGGGGGSVPTFNTATITLTTAGWSNNSQTVTVQGVTASNIVIVNPAPASYDEYVVDNVRCTGQSANSLTFTCDFVPDEAITVSVIITSVTAVYGGEVS